MPAEHDPLDVLREAWRRAEPPTSPEIPGGALSDEDEVTRATVAWARHAWATLPVPAVPARPRRGVFPLLRRLTSIPAAAAAAVLLAAAVVLQLDRTATRSSPTPSDVVSWAGAAPKTSSPPPSSDSSLVAAAVPPRTSDVRSPDPLVVLLGSEACVCAPTDPLRRPLPVLPVAPPSLLLEPALRTSPSPSWSDAAEEAQLVLERAGSSPEDRLRALCQLALSFQALGQRDESTAYLSRLEEEISDLRAR